MWNLNTKKNNIQSQFTYNAKQKHKNYDWILQEAPKDNHVIQ